MAAWIAFLGSLLLVRAVINDLQAIPSISPRSLLPPPLTKIDARLPFVTSLEL